MPSRIHFPASLGSTVITRFLATTDALTSSGGLFGCCQHEHPACAGSEVHCLSRLRFLPFCLQSCDVPIGLFYGHVVFFSARVVGVKPQPLIGLTPVGGVGFRSRFRVYLARSPSHPTESSSGCGSFRASFLWTGSSLPVAPHGRFTPPQLLSTTGRLTPAWRGLSPRRVDAFTVAPGRPYGTTRAGGGRGATK
jgi:hypothetical protein